MMKPILMEAPELQGTKPTQWAVIRKAAQLRQVKSLVLIIITHLHQLVAYIKSQNIKLTPSVSIM